MLDLGLCALSSAASLSRTDRLALLSELRSAIDNDELLLHYQPKLDLRAGTLVGVEALVRWQHSQHAAHGVHDHLARDRCDREQAEPYRWGWDAAPGPVASCW
jgi:hypothetical protein